jgi:hypothetical protein
MKSYPNFSQRMQLTRPHWNLKSCFALFRSVWVNLGPFRRFIIPGSNHAELLQLMQKFKPQSCIRFATNLLNPRNLILNSFYGVFHSVWGHLGAFCYGSKLDAINAKVRATKSHQMFPQRTDPIHTIGPQTHLFLRFIVFGCIWDNFVTA